MAKDSLIRIVVSVGKKTEVRCPVRLGGYQIIATRAEDDHPASVVHLTEDQDGRPCLVAALMDGPESIVAYQLPIYELCHVLSHDYRAEGQTGCDGFAVVMCPDLEPAPRGSPS